MAFTHLPADLLERDLRHRARVAIGCKDKANLERLGQALAARFGDTGIELLGATDGEELVEMMASDSVDAAVRGVLPAHDVKEALAARFGAPSGKLELHRAVLVEVNRALRLVGPVGIDEGNTLEERLSLARKGAGLLESLGRLVATSPGPSSALPALADPPTLPAQHGLPDPPAHPVPPNQPVLSITPKEPALPVSSTQPALPASKVNSQMVEETEGWKPNIGVLSLGRMEDRGRSTAIAASLKAGEELTTSLLDEGYRAHHFDIRIERAAAECDLLLTPDGTHGNLIFRTLHYLGGVPAWGAPALGLWPEVVFIDSSRARASFTAPVRLAARISQVEVLQERTPEVAEAARISQVEILPRP